MKKKRYKVCIKYNSYSVHYSDNRFILISNLLSTSSIFYKNIKLPLSRKSLLNLNVKKNQIYNIYVEESNMQHLGLLYLVHNNYKSIYGLKNVGYSSNIFNKNTDELISELSDTVLGYQVHIKTH